MGGRKDVCSDDRTHVERAVRRDDVRKGTHKAKLLGRSANTNRKTMKLMRLLKQVKETVANGRVTCDACGWSWNVKDGTDGEETNPYLCHKCKHDNRPEKPKKKQ